MVAGNVNVRQATRNALHAIELCGAEVPVYVGAKKPLLRAYTNATWFHGRNGFGDHDYPDASSFTGKGACGRRNHYYDRS
jgi:inosine-uridine nucleoside N-ribohydrolase